MFKKHPILVPLLSLIVFYVIILGRTAIPSKDTFGCAIWAHHLFNSIHQGGTGLWIPYQNWGNTFHLFLLAAIHPTALVLAPLFRFSFHWNTLPFFYFSFLLSEGLLLIGCYALGTRLFKSTRANLFVCISVLGSCIWFSQPAFNFLSYYLIPLTLFFIVRAIEEASISDLLISIIIVVISSTFGLSLYIGLTQILFCVVFGTTIYFLQRPNSKEFLKSIRPMTWASGVFLLLAVIVPCVFLASGGPLSFSSTFRDDHARVTYHTFLNYGYHWALEGFQGIFGGLDNSNDVFIYGGTLMLPLASVALVFGKTKRQIPFIITFVFCFLFYLGQNSFVAPLLYHVPGFAMYRHIGNIAPMFRLIFLFLAGFGFEILESDLSSKERYVRSPSLRFLHYALLFGMLGFLATDFRSPSPPKFAVLFFYLTSLCILYRAKTGESSFRNLTPILFLIIASIDVWSYRARLLHEKIPDVGEKAWNLFQVKDLTYEPQRIEKYLLTPAFRPFREKEIIPTISLDEWTRTFTNNIEPFLNVDPCYNKFRDDYQMPWSAQLSRIADTRSLIGCETPKLKVFHKLYIAPTNERAIQAFQNSNDRSHLLVGSGRNFLGLSEPLNSMARSEIVGSTIEVQEFSATHIKLSVITPPGSHPYWLYYADTWHPQWNAWVNGNPVPVALANIAFKALPIPPGKAIVELKFFSWKDTFALCFFWLEIFVGLIFVFYNVGYLQIWRANKKS